MVLFLHVYYAHMSTQVKNFTTTFSVSLLDWLDDVSREMKMTKKEIIEQALEGWRKQYVKRQIRSSYASMKHDEEAKILAEDGLGDFLASVKKCEKV